MQPLMQALLTCTTLVLVLQAQGAPLGTVFHANVTVFSANALVPNLMPAIQSALLLQSSTSAGAVGLDSALV